MTTILCYGDSNTYGYNPVNGLRYPKDVRWTGVLQKLLGEQYAVIEEGCNGRTTVFEDIAEPWKAGPCCTATVSGLPLPASPHRGPGRSCCPRKMPPT